MAVLGIECAWRWVDTYTTATPGFDEAERGHGSGDRDSPKDSLYYVRGEPVTFQRRAEATRTTTTYCVPALWKNVSP